MLSIPLCVFSKHQSMCSRKRCVVDPRGVALAFCEVINLLMSRLPRKMLRSPLKHPTGVFLNAAFNSPPSQIVKTWKSHRKGGFSMFWWTRGELNPCPKIRWVGFLRGQSVMKFSRAGRKQTRDTAAAALFWMTGSRTKHRCTFPADLTHAASRRTLAGYGWRYATALLLGSQSDFFIVCV